MGCSLPFCHCRSSSRILEIHIHNKSRFNFLNTATNRYIDPSIDKRFDWDGSAFELIPEMKFSNITFQLMPDRHHPHFLKVNGLELPLNRPSFEKTFTIKSNHHNLVVKLNKVGDYLRVKLEVERRNRVFQAPYNNHSPIKEYLKSWVILATAHPNSSEEILKRFLRKHHFWDKDIKHIIADFHYMRNQNCYCRFIEIKIDIKRRIIDDMVPSC